MTDGFYMFDRGVESNIGDDTIMMRDGDGSLTGTAGVTVVRPGVYYADADKCSTMEGWNMDACTQQFIRV